MRQNSMAPLSPNFSRHTRAPCSGLRTRRRQRRKALKSIRPSPGSLPQNVVRSSLRYDGLVGVEILDAGRGQRTYLDIQAGLFACLEPQHIDIEQPEARVAAVRMRQRNVLPWRIECSPRLQHVRGDEMLFHPINFTTIASIRFGASRGPRGRRQCSKSPPLGL